MPQLAGLLVAIVVGFLLTHRRNYGVLGQPLGILLIPLAHAWGRIDVTTGGIVHRSPFYRRTIRWSDAKAIFREGSSTKRSFLVVGPGCAIHLPAHLAVDRELMKKVLYSLPDPILCVNFDETTLKGYKRREKAKEPARSEDLVPALTS